MAESRMRPLHPFIIDEAIPLWNLTLENLEFRDYKEARWSWKMLKIVMEESMKEMEKMFPPEDSKGKPKRPLKKQNNK